MKKALVVVAAMALIASSAMAAVSVVEILPVGTDTSTNAKALTMWGTTPVVVGTSGSRAMIYDPTNGIRGLMQGSLNIASVSGVGVRTYNGNKELAIVYKDPSTTWTHTQLSTDMGLTWGAYVREVNWPTTTGSPGLIAYNGLGASASSDVFFTAQSQSSGTVVDQWGVTTFSGAATTFAQHGVKGTNGNAAYIDGISANGLSVGARKPSSRLNYMVQASSLSANVGSNYFQALNTDNQGEAYAVNTAGTRIAGTSNVKVSGTLDGFTHPYIATFTAGSGPNTISPTTPTRTGAYELPIYGGGYVTSAAMSGQPYGMMADGNYVVGRTWTSAGGDRAALWDVKDPTNPVLIDLTDYMTAHGGMGSFSALRDAYSVVSDGGMGMYISGYGAGTGGYTRAFLIHLDIPEPATALFLAIGGLAMLRRRR